MGIFTDCAVGKFCEKDNFVDSELNEEGVCNICDAVTYYVDDKITENKQMVEYIAWRDNVAEEDVISHIALQAEIQEQNERVSLEELRYNQREGK